MLWVTGMQHKYTHEGTVPEKGIYYLKYVLFRFSLWGKCIFFPAKSANGGSHHCRNPFLEVKERTAIPRIWH